MKKTPSNALRNFIISHATTIFIVNIVFSTIVSYFGYEHLKTYEAQSKDHRLHKLITDLDLAFEQYMHPLQGMTSAIHLAKFQFSARDFRRAAESRNLYKNFEGTRGFGFIRRVKQSDLAAYVKKQRAERADFQLKRLDPNVRSNELFIVEVIEPIEENKKAVGLVISDEKNRGDAAFNSMKWGKPMLTLPIQLIQLNRIEPGFVLFNPVYQSPTIPEAMEERMRDHVGWVYTALIPAQIVNFAVAQNPFTEIIKIEESDELGNVLSVYKNENPKLNLLEQQWRKAHLLGRDWNVLTALRAPDTWNTRIKSILIFIVLILLSGSFLYYSKLVQTQMRFDKSLLELAQKEVEAATIELKNKQALLYSKSKLSLMGEWPVVSHMKSIIPWQ